MKDSDILIAFAAMCFQRDQLDALQAKSNAYDAYRRKQLIDALNDAIGRTEMIVKALINSKLKG